MMEFEREMERLLKNFGETEKETGIKTDDKKIIIKLMLSEYHKGYVDGLRETGVIMNDITTGLIKTFKADTDKIMEILDSKLDD